MPGVNKVILLGHLGKDPETRHIQSGQQVTSFSLATSERYKDRSGERQEKTEWHRCVCWGRLAEIADQYLTKGAQVYVEGKLTTRHYEKEGQKHYATEVVVRELTMLGGGNSGPKEPKTTRRREPPQDDAGWDKPAQRPAGTDDYDDDIPF
ncbi:MAG: single-stranded DNA-binding protein [Gammaproteobacteria bacterium]|nr:single-stranded DNA-binding protein [Gammaproteobacteria bacterium]